MTDLEILALRNSAIIDTELALITIGILDADAAGDEQELQNLNDRLDPLESEIATAKRHAALYKSVS